MRVWRVVLLLDLALAVGVGAGYVWWGRQAAQLSRELVTARAAAATAGGERQYTGEGVVRAVLPELNVIVITHGEIPGYMPAMTMGFRASSPKIHEAVRIGDAVRFTLRGTPPNMVIVAVQTEKP
jgi:Cu/Ag efflux protein CusF